MKKQVAFFTSLGTELAGDTYAQVVTDNPGYEWTFHAEQVDEYFAPYAIVSFCSGVIIPKWLLDRAPGRAWNVHPGTPWRPGRDCVHWAIYHGDESIGATLHRMIPAVDQGEVLAVEMERRNPAWTIEETRLASERCASILLTTCIGDLLAGTFRPLNDPSALHWQGKPTTRADFHAICQIPPWLCEEEVERRRRAFDVPGYDNLRCL